jgi:hypothetical protein
MKQKYFILISTTKNSLGQYDKMLELLQNRECCEATFGNNFYPVIGINNNGVVKCICDEEGLPENDLVLLIIPDNKMFENSNVEKDEFSKYIKKIAQECDTLHVVLHKGGDSLHDTHQKAILEIAKENLPKLKVAKCRHTPSSSQNTEHALGDGLEMVAKAVLANPINIEDFKAALDYLKSKPEYFSPLKESLIRLHKTLSISLISNPSISIDSLKNQPKYELAFGLLDKVNSEQKSNVNEVLKWTSSKIIELSQS